MRIQLFMYIVIAVAFMAEKNCVALEIENPTKIGVLAFEPKSLSAQKWSVLQEYLSTEIPDTNTSIIPMTHSEMESALKSQDMDFVLTNPGHYLLLQHMYGLSAPLVTLKRENRGRQLNAFGGVIFTRAERQKITTLADIVTRKIATPTPAAFGAYQLQAYEILRHDLPKLSSDQLLLTGLPHDEVVNAVAQGKADVGFARAGTLERMAMNGTIRLEDFRVINKQTLADFPVMVSTHLYPEWPLAAAPGTNLEVSKNVITALLKMEAKNLDTPLPSNVTGFSPPADYTEAEQVLRALRVPPYTRVPKISFTDLCSTYSWQIICALGGLLTALMGVLYLLVSHSRCRKAKQLFQQCFVHDNIPRLVLAFESKRIINANLKALELFSCNKEQLFQKTIFDVIPEPHAEVIETLDTIYTKKDLIVHGCIQTSPYFSEHNCQLEVNFHISRLEFSNNPLIICNIIPICKEGNLPGKPATL